MSVNFLTKRAYVGQRHYRWRMVVGLPAWVFSGFVLAQIILVGGLLSAKSLNISFPSSDDVIFNTVSAAIIYVLSLTIVIGLPWLLKKRRTSRADLGLTRLPSWMDILLSPAGFVIYLAISAFLVWAATSLIPGFNVNQVQAIGFENVSQRYQYLLAFVTLIIVAPIAEEILFRGYLYGKLKTYVPLWAAMLVTSLLFGAVHGQWNVAVDTFALSIVMCSLREVTGSIWAGILLHMLKNSIAFYFLFINPSLLNTLGG